MKNLDTGPQGADEAQSDAGIMIRWRGRQDGPFPLSVIERKLAANEIGLLHEICSGGKWTTLKNYLAEREAEARAQRQARDEAERRAREAEERKAREREESRQAAALAEERRKNDLLERANARTSGQSSAPAHHAPTAENHRGAVILTFGLLGLLFAFRSESPPGPWVRMINARWTRDLWMPPAVP